MLEWVELDREYSASGSELVLRERGGRYEIRVDGYELMGSHAHGSEEAMAEIACKSVRAGANATVLIGGLGMGFTLRAALNHLPPDAKVVIAELMDKVIVWNRSHIGHLAQWPLRDRRVEVIHTDVMVLLQSANAHFDVILMDVDNGPTALTTASNNELYGQHGLRITRNALKPHGVLAFWCADANDAFVERLESISLLVKRIDVPALGIAGGPLHTIYFASTAMENLPQ
jgi:spermidine synthase